MHELLLIADAGWIKLVFVAVVFIVWIFNALVGDKAKAKAKARPMQRPVPPRPIEGVPNEQRPAGQQPLVGEIEEFLKRANRKREEKARRKQQPKVAKPAPPAPPKPRRLVDGGSESQQFEIGTNRSVADHVQRHLNTGQFAQRAESLVDEDIAKDDAEREAHRKQVFEHKLGSLSDTSTGSTKDPAIENAASQKASREANALPLTTLLGNPDSIRQAIILNEILTRPEQRW